MALIQHNAAATHDPLEALVLSEPLLTADDAAELLRVRRSTVYELARNRRLPHVRVGRGSCSCGRTSPPGSRRTASYRGREIGARRRRGDGERGGGERDLVRPLDATNWRLAVARHKAAVGATFSAPWLLASTTFREAPRATRKRPRGRHRRANSHARPP